MNNKLILLAALALGGCAMTTGSTLAQLQASTWQLQGASGDTFTLQVAGDKVAGKGGCNPRADDVGVGGMKVAHLHPPCSIWLFGSNNGLYLV